MPRQTSEGENASSKWHGSLARAGEIRRGDIRAGTTDVQEPDVVASVFVACNLMKINSRAETSSSISGRFEYDISKPDGTGLQTASQMLTRMRYPKSKVWVVWR